MIASELQLNQCTKFETVTIKSKEITDMGSI